MLGVATGAQAHCTSAADESAFDVGALKSELSVLAVQCGDDTEYNHFVERARSVLVHEDGVVNAWYKKMYGRAAQPRYDSFITTQANEQSLAGQHEGSEFCPHWRPVFDEAMAVPVASLGEYAAAKNLMPIDLACSTAGPAVGSATRAANRTSTSHTTRKK